jgi:hypothetical protein
MRMLNYDNFAVTLGRAVESFRQGPDAVPEQKIALRALAALVKLGGATVEVVDGELHVDGNLVPVTLPGVRGLLTQLECHDVHAIRIERNAAPAGLLQLLRALAVPFGGFPRDEDPETRLRDAGVPDIGVTVRHPRSSGPTRRRVSGADQVPTLKVAIADAVQDAPRLSRPEAAVASIALEPAAPDLPERLAAAAAGIREELEHGRPSGAVRAVAQLMQLVDAAPSGPAAEALRETVSPLLTRTLFDGAVSCALAEESRAAAQRVLRAGGAAATEVLRNRLLTADTIADRQHYLALLRRQPDGLRYLILLLQHSDADAVRRTAEVVADERILEAVPMLIRLSPHPDSAARRAIVRALATLANPDAVETLSRLLGEPAADTRLDVARALAGPALGALVPVVERAGRRERDPEVLAELARGLGRIGTPEAVAALARWAQPTGWRLWQRNQARRRAAVEGLRVAGGAGAVGILRGLARDRDADVHRAAMEALEDLSIAARSRVP